MGGEAFACVWAPHCYCAPHAVGDLHGDWQKAIDAFRMAGVIRVTDDEVMWSGGDTVVVQLGDVLDRGDYEIGASKACTSCYIDSSICFRRNLELITIVFASQPS